ncbi:MAG: succinate dehydrogenase/fumarate reductase flavoprotein subunit [Nitrososphaerales archaeon]
MESLEHDIVIIGGGGAGLRAAIAAAEEDSSLNIAILSKVYPMRSHTVSAEGGTGAVVREYDNHDLHSFDTIKGSDFLADQDVVEYFVDEAPKEVIQMEHWGCPWSRDEDGHISVRAFGGMSVKRTVFAADKTGFFMLHTLYQNSLKYDNLKFYDEWFATSLITDGKRTHGVTAINIKNGAFAAIRSKAVIFAAGGAGQVYQFTTNAQIKTGDGMAIAFRAGIGLKDMEFVQFHPTALPGTGILMTEGSRGEGGYLVNKDGERFLKRYVPEKMELGPRDILSRSIMTEFSEGRGIEGKYGNYVHLDLRHLGKEKIDSKLPFVRELAKEYIGIDPVYEPIPVRPAVHYTMGGINTDIKTQTNIDGVYAAGEVACGGLNGANRLGSNSLSECLVFGARAGIEAAKKVKTLAEPSSDIVAKSVEQEEKRIYSDILKNETGHESIAEIRTDLRRTMEENVGIFREDAKLRTATNDLKKFRKRWGKVKIEDKTSVYNTNLTAALELDFMIDIASGIVKSALERRESRGSHYRNDYAKRDDAKFLKHSLVFYEKDKIRVEYLPVIITKWQPAERVY